MTLDFGDFEFVTRLGVVVFATAFWANTFAFCDGELRFAIMAFADGLHPVDHQFAIFDFIGVFDGGGPALLHEARNDACGFTDGEGHFMDFGEMILLHEVLESANDFYRVSELVHALILFKGSDGNLHRALDRMSSGLRKDRGEVFAIDAGLLD